MMTKYHEITINRALENTDRSIDRSIEFVGLLVEFLSINRKYIVSQQVHIEKVL